MKKAVVVAVLCLLSASLPSAFAQRPKSSVEVVVDSASVVPRGDSVAVSVTFRLSSLRVARERVVVVSPYLTSGGGDVAQLPPVAAYGLGRRASVFRRDAPAVVGNVTGRTDELGYPAVSVPLPVTVSRVFPREAWMRDSRLMLAASEYGGPGGPVAMGERLAGGWAAPSEPVFAFDWTFLVPDAEPVKERSSSFSFPAEFRPGSAVFVLSLGGNAAGLDSLEAFVSSFRRSPYADVRSVRLRGYASPDGSEKSNLRLSEARVKSVLAALERDGFDVSGVDASGGGEDWDGVAGWLRANASSEPDFSGLMDLVLDRTRARDWTESRIRSGWPGLHARMVRELYPSLRRIGCTVKYVVRAFGPSELAGVCASRPGFLSCAEFYALASSCAEGSPSRSEILVRAGEVLDDPVAVMNAVALLLGSGSAGRAGPLLPRMGRSPEAEYLRGAWCVAAGLYDRARAHFTAGGSAACRGGLDFLSRHDAWKVESER